jgi:hypothetical protein
MTQCLVELNGRLIITLVNVYLRNAIAGAWRTDKQTKHGIFIDHEGERVDLRFTFPNKMKITTDESRIVKWENKNLEEIGEIFSRIPYNVKFNSSTLKTIMSGEASRLKLLRDKPDKDCMDDEDDDSDSEDELKFTARQCYEILFINNDDGNLITFDSYRSAVGLTPLTPHVLSSLPFIIPTKETTRSHSSHNSSSSSSISSLSSTHSAETVQMRRTIKDLIAKMSDDDVRSQVAMLKANPDNYFKLKDNYSDRLYLEICKGATEITMKKMKRKRKEEEKTALANKMSCIEYKNKEESGDGVQDNTSKRMRPESELDGTASTDPMKTKKTKNKTDQYQTSTNLSEQTTVQSLITTTTLADSDDTNYVCFPFQEQTDSGQKLLGIDYQTVACNDEKTIALYLSTRTTKEMEKKNAPLQAQFLINAFALELIPIPGQGFCSLLCLLYFWRKSNKIQNENLDLSVPTVRKEMKNLIDTLRKNKECNSEGNLKSFSRILNNDKTTIAAPSQIWPTVTMMAQWAITLGLKINFFESTVSSCISSYLQDGWLQLVSTGGKLESECSLEDIEKIYSSSDGSFNIAFKDSHYTPLVFSGGVTSFIAAYRVKVSKFLRKSKVSITPTNSSAASTQLTLAVTDSSSFDKYSSSSTLLMAEKNDVGDEDGPTSTNASSLSSSSVTSSSENGASNENNLPPRNAVGDLSTATAEINNILEVEEQEGDDNDDDLEEIQGTQGISNATDIDSDTDLEGDITPATQVVDNIISSSQ